MLRLERLQRDMSSHPEKQGYQRYEAGTNSSGRDPGQHLHSARGHSRSDVYSHQPYSNHHALGATVAPEHVNEHDQLYYSHVSPHRFGTSNPSSSLPSAHQHSRTESVYSHSSGLAHPSSHPAGSGLQHTNTRKRSSATCSSGLQQGRAAHRRRRDQTCGGSEEELSDDAENSPTTSLQAQGTGNFSTLSIHSRRKMYVAGLEGYLSESRETLLQSGHEPPQVQRAESSRGLNIPTKNDLLNRMERRNGDLRDVADQLKDESESASYRTAAKGS